ncbi:MAG: hypothetical protein CV087_07195 [Candidatus Brocadia sp. WS118]|nr:MAG: hypothetical protein CV087_07195 [Candidatus Brocadia sp. WS118]
MSTTKKRIKPKHPYIERRQGVCGGGGEPVIAGTRISVGLIVEMEMAGHSVDEMVALYPHITHAQIYDALSHYYDHKEEIERMMDENKEVYWMEKTKGENWRK